MKKIKFRHYRLVPAYVIGYKDNPFVLVKSSHGRNAVDWEDNPMSQHYRACGGATYVALYEDGELMKEAVAFCHPKENFSRAKGRQYALEYLEKGVPSDYSPALAKWTDIPEELKKFVCTKVDNPEK